MKVFSGNSDLLKGKSVDIRMAQIENAHQGEALPINYNSIDKNEYLTGFLFIFFPSINRTKFALNSTTFAV